MSHQLYIGQRVALQLQEFEDKKQIQFTITGFGKYNQFDMNGNELVHILFVNEQLQFTSLSVHFSLLTAIPASDQ